MDAQQQLFGLMAVAEEHQKAVKAALDGLTAERAALHGDPASVWCDARHANDLDIWRDASLGRARPRCDVDDVGGARRWQHASIAG